MKTLFERIIYLCVHVRADVHANAQHDRE